MQFFCDLGIVGLRILMALFFVFILFECFASMRRQKRMEKPLVVLRNELTKESIPVICWENSLGRSKSCDIVLEDMTVSRNHCVLLRRQSGWYINDIGSKSGTLVNGEYTEGRTKVCIDDRIQVGSTPLTLCRGEDYDKEIKHSWFFSRASKRPFVSAPLLLVLVNLFHIFMCTELCISRNMWRPDAFMILGATLLFSWIVYGFSRGVFKRKNFELETVAVLFMGLGAMLLVNEKTAKDAWVQIIAATLGAVLYMFILEFIKNPDRIVNWRMAVMIGAVVMFALNLAFGEVQFGAANRINIGGVTIQPSELVKIAYIFVGASALDHLQTKRNFIEFVVFSAICVGALAIMGDFGTALIFFLTFIMISITRSGDYKTVILAVVGAVFAVGLILSFKPYIAERFATWGHALETPYDQGYQQSRVLTYMASGGLFGVGVGSGFLRYVPASETDLVFGVITEEMGFVIAIAIAAAICALVVSTRSLASRSRSTFYSISAVCAASMMLVQSALNIFGCTDLIPFTGVTLPFISAGGSSMLSCWGLLAFIKAADERTYSKIKKG